MAEIWGMALVTVAGGVIAGRAAKKKDKSDKAHEQAMTKEESELAAQRSGFDMALEDFYVQKNRFEKQRGLDQFRQFSTMGSFAPGAEDSSGRVANPVMPKYNEFAVEQPIDPNAGQGGSGGGQSIFSKRNELHKKSRDPFGLF